MTSSSCAATPSSILTNCQQVIGELTRGLDKADELRLILRQSGVDFAPASALDLVGQIMDNLTQSLSMLGESDVVSQVPAVLNTPCLRSEDSGYSCKTPAPKDRRGCYKRKKTSESRTTVTATSFDDGLAWRKYGQKSILNAKFPRNYFRCTHKFDQGCPALKQVQQIQEDPPLVRTTYQGHHTCKNLLKSPNHIIVDDTTQDASIIWSFHKPETSFVLDSSVEKAGIKQENEDYYISPELTMFGGSDDLLGGFSSGSDHGSDVYSCTASTHMDMMGSVDLDDFLESF